MAKVDLDLVKNVITQQLADPQAAHAILSRIQEELNAIPRAFPFLVAGRG